VIEATEFELPNYEAFLYWRNEEIYRAKEKDIDERILKDLTCTYPAEAIEVMRKIFDELSPLAQIVPEKVAERKRLIDEVKQTLDECLKKPAETQPASGGKAVDTPVTLREFMREYCEPLRENLLESRVKSLQSLHQRKKIELQHVGEYKQGQSKKYLPRYLISKWPTYRKVLLSLPELKQS
jgi:hypothetical protein